MFVKKLFCFNEKFWFCTPKNETNNYVIFLSDIKIKFKWM